MNTNFRAVTLSALFCFAGAALGQEGTFVSGLLHTPVGGATLGTPEGRRLPVNNLGSSGQDGVEVQLNTTTGGTIGVDIPTLIQTPGAVFRNRYKGWDGLIYGNHRITSNSDGTV